MIVQFLSHLVLDSILRPPMTAVSFFPMSSVRSLHTNNRVWLFCQILHFILGCLDVCVYMYGVRTHWGLLFVLATRDLFPPLSHASFQSSYQRAHVAHGVFSLVFCTWPHSYLHILILILLYCWIIVSSCHTVCLWKGILFGPVYGD